MTEKGMSRFILVILLVVHLPAAQHQARALGSTEDLLTLRKSLFSNYTGDIPPVYKITDTVNVQTSLFLIAILDFKEVSGVVTLKYGMILSWIDHRLVWSPSDHGGIEYFSMNSSLVWKPRIFLLTSADDIGEIDMHGFDIRLRNYGFVEMTVVKLVKSTCFVDMTNFPADSHKCSLLFTPLLRYHNETMLTFTNTEILMEFYTPSGEWTVDGTSVKNFTEYAPDQSIIAYTVYISRKPAFYFLSLNVPLFLICFLNPFVFLLPASSGERVSFTVTLFLSLEVYLTLISDVMPKVSDPISGMSYFLVLVMCYCFLLIILTIFTLRVEAVQDVKRFPIWLLKFVYKRELKCEKFKTNKVNDGKLSSPSVELVSECDESLDEKENKTATENKHDCDTDELWYNVEKEKVMNLIDKTLFYVTMLVMAVINAAFTFGYYKII